jgi:hypothetical protein
MIVSFPPIRADQTTECIVCFRAADHATLVTDLVKVSGCRLSELARLGTGRRTAHDMTPEQYREKWGLAEDYPLIAAGYSAARSKMTKKLGLGRKAGTKIVRKKRR